MRKPRIAVTPRLSNDNKHQGDNIDYMDAILNAGGVPYIVALNAPVEEIIQDFDGLLVTGGEDLEPSLFNETEDYPIEKTLYKVDILDLELIRAFNKANKPILGICRGIQSINVAFGGSLYQDLVLQYPNLRKDAHQQHLMTPPVDRNAVCHSCTTTPNTVLNSILGDEIMVNTYHHQCVKQVAEGFTPSVISEDGLVEGIENGKNIIGVQWHPERLVWMKEHNDLFKWLIENCK